MRAHVIVVAGPSGSGKSRLAERTGLPVLRLDDFYRAGDDPALPRIATGHANAGLVDWDDPASWLHDDAVAAVGLLCHEGRAEVPVYDIAHNGPVGTHVLELGEHRLFVAEGIFAATVVADLAAAGVLADALCVTQHPLVTFWRRLLRDLRERRKPPLVLVRRGWVLMRAQPDVVAAAVRLGCREVSPHAGVERIADLLTAADHTPSQPQ